MKNPAQLLNFADRCRSPIELRECANHMERSTQGAALQTLKLLIPNGKQTIHKTPSPLLPRA